jgi:hypothetical protein
MAHTSAVLHFQIVGYKTVVESDLKGCSMTCFRHHRQQECSPGVLLSDLSRQCSLHLRRLQGTYHYTGLMPSPFNWNNILIKSFRE